MGTRRPDLREHAVAERTDLANLLATLSAEQWASPSLCSAWSVRDVAVHVVSYDQLSWPRLALTFAQGLGRVSAVNEVALRRFSDLDDAEVAGLVAARRQPRGLTAALGGGIALTDGTIHHQDIRRALGLPRTIATERLRRVLDFALAAPTIPARRNARGLRLVADDLDWSHGDGDEVTGPGEALLMALAGRPDALGDLAGPGLPVLASRVGP